jgi:predicted nucleotidyltransferase
VADGDGIRRFHLAPEDREAVLRRMAEAAAHLEGVVLAVAYGSFLAGEHFRDIDVAVLFDEPLSRRALGAAEDALLAALGGLKLPVDLVPLNDAPPHFRAEVLERGRVLYEREPREAIEAWVRAKSESLDLAAWQRVHGVRSW